MSEPDKQPVETPGEWLRFADENLFVAEQAIFFEEPAWHTICFLCQSAAEKYLKAYLIAAGWKLERTHDIVVLMGLCSDYDSAFTDLQNAGAILNEYIVRPIDGENLRRHHLAKTSLLRITTKG